MFDEFRTCIEEAAHGYLSEMFGRKVDLIHVIPNGGHAGETHCDTRHGTLAEATDFATVLMGGLAASMIFGTSPELAAKRSSDDIRRAANVAGIYCRDVESQKTFMSDAASRAAGILEKDFGRVRLLASVLKLQRRIRGDDPILVALRRRCKKRISAASRKHRRGRRTGALRGRSSGSFKNTGGSLSVDEANGVIFGCAVASVGPALGHGFSLDADSLKAFEQFGNDAGDAGIRSRYTHPAINEKRDPVDGSVSQEVADDLGTTIGVIKNFKVDGDVLRGDLHIGDYASALPGIGDAKTYLLKLAQENPALFGLSCFFGYELEQVMDDYGNVIQQVARPLNLSGVDVVGTPAVNKNGMLAAALFDPQPGDPGWNDLSPQDQAKAPIPIAPDFPADRRGDYLRAIAKRGPLSRGGFLSQFGDDDDDTFDAITGYLSDNGYLSQLDDGRFALTPAGHVQAMMKGWQGKAK